MHVAFVTYQALPDLSDDDRLAATALQARGARVSAVVWDDPAVDWARFDRIVVRSCWDYHLRLSDFEAWIDRLDGLGLPLRNPAPVLRWNARKTYLRVLAASGARVLPTHWAEPGDDEPLAALLARRGWARAVAKPVVSASAHRTWVATPDDGAAGESRWRAALAAGAMLVQPFAEPVVREGEWSLVFLGGRFSHAALKRAAPGDFRVQHEHGGTAVRREPPPRLVADASAALALAPSACLYARVDGYDDDGLVLMELELLEPSLFLALDPEAPTRFAEAVLADAPAP